jgi:hypothetical protein
MLLSSASVIASLAFAPAISQAAASTADLPNPTGHRTRIKIMDPMAGYFPAEVYRIPRETPHSLTHNPFGGTAMKKFTLRKSLLATVIASLAFAPALSVAAEQTPGSMMGSGQTMMGSGQGMVMDAKGNAAMMKGGNMMMQGGNMMMDAKRMSTGEKMMMDGQTMMGKGGSMGTGQTMMMDGQKMMLDGKKMMMDGYEKMKQGKKQVDMDLKKGGK